MWGTGSCVTEIRAITNYKCTVDRAFSTDLMYKTVESNYTGEAESGSRTVVPSERNKLTATYNQLHI